MSKYHEILGLTTELQRATILTQEALNFVAHLHRTFNSTRLDLLDRRKLRQQKLSQGYIPDFLEETKHIRESSWKVASTPKDLEDRRVEITGPPDRKMMINAFNSGAKVFMADLEDAQSPTWNNMLEGQLNLFRAVRRNLDFEVSDHKKYFLNENIATLVVRPRGWHLDENHIQVSGEDVSASLFDFGLFFFHNAKELISGGSGPYFYLPKLENHLEARLWNQVFVEAQSYLNIPQGTVRATVLIETILAAFEMEEILFELKEHASGLNAGRWDYIFSMIKCFAKSSDYILPDRKQINMSVPFMHSYSELLVKSCHKRGAHAIGGMSAFIPSRKDQKTTEEAFIQVSADKKREALSGFDGTWVAHPDLVPIAKKVFDLVLGETSHQKHVSREDVKASNKDLLNPYIKGGKITVEGIRTNISVALQYINKWFAGVGAVAINNLMEDAATAEISRAQLWQWLYHKIELEDGTIFTPDEYRKIKAQELSKLQEISNEDYSKASNLMDKLVLSNNFTDFLTLPAYNVLTAKNTQI